MVASCNACSSVLSIVMSPCSFIDLLIWVFSLFLLDGLAKGLSILFILKNQLLVWVMFPIFLFSFSFIFCNLYYFFTSANVGLSLFFCFSLAHKIRLFKLFCFCFLIWAFIAMNFPLWTAFAPSPWVFICCILIFVCLKILLYFPF